ncbi:MAG: DUF2147 domain-containing protein [Thiohalobacteraceae bacterium]
MRASPLAMLLLALPTLAFAQASPEGRWKTIDDETGRVKSIVEITESGGKLRGQVVEILQSDRGPNPTCDKCKGANKDKPVKGMTILWDLARDGDEWTGGTILDPAKGKTYKSKLKLIDAGKLGVSGCVAFICREQVWIRE